MKSTHNLILATSSSAASRKEENKVEYFATDEELLGETTHTSKPKVRKPNSVLGNRVTSGSNTGMAMRTTFSAQSDFY
tara:strand:+ start:683 stop:916 length:234 start_codon:yes stop_codon:yes gene_type:complete